MIAEGRQAVRYDAWLIFIFAFVLAGCSEERSSPPPVTSAQPFSTNQTEELLASSTVQGKGIPYGESGKGTAMKLATVSDDATYGYTSQNPIKVGGYKEGEGDKYQVQYLRALFGPNGQHIFYERLGSCCPFATTNGMMGQGLLDVYRITYDGLKTPIKLYIDLYDSEPPKAPKGFRIGL